MGQQDTFSVNFEGNAYLIHSYLINNELIFKVHFPDKQQPLLLVRTFGNEGWTWNSIQDNREQDVQSFGRLIDAYLASQGN